MPVILELNRICSHIALSECLLRLSSGYMYNILHINLHFILSCSNRCLIILNMQCDTILCLIFCFLQRFWQKWTKVKRPSLFDLCTYSRTHLILKYWVSFLWQGHGMEIVPSYSQRPTSPAQTTRNGGPSWESASSSPHYGRVRSDDMHLAGSNEQE